jgi:divalent metal cation (Fe/Co/Zn/Cd) transporter
VFTRLLDGVEPEFLDAVHHAVDAIPAVQHTETLKARWLGHRLYVELDVALAPTLSLAETQALTIQIQQTLKEALPYLGWVRVRGVPATPDPPSPNRVNSGTLEIDAPAVKDL